MNHTWSASWFLEQPNYDAGADFLATCSFGKGSTYGPFRGPGVLVRARYTEKRGVVHYHAAFEGL